MKVLFICMANTCRSQMAEGFAKHYGIDAESAGVSAGPGVNPFAVIVMSEIGIDISKQTSKEIPYETLGRYDTIISMCSVTTADVCPSTFLGGQANWNIKDPLGEDVEVYREVRDLIRRRVEELVRCL